MQITSNSVGAHILSDANHAEQAQHDATTPESALQRQGIIIVGGAPEGKGGPTENVAFNYGKLSVEYAQQKADGNGVNPQPPAATSSSLASFVPEGGLHPVVTEPTTQAKTQAKSTHAKPAGISDFQLLMAAIGVSLDHMVNGLGRPRG